MSRDAQPRFALGKVRHVETNEEAEVIRLHGSGSRTGTSACLKGSDGNLFTGKQPEKWEPVKS